MSTEEKLVWVKKVEKKGKKFLVFINDEKESITFTEDQIVGNRIIKGNSFYQKDWDKIIKSLDEGVIFDKTLKYIDYKPRTEKEVINYLEEHSVADAIILKIIKKLKEIKFIDDERYTRIFVEEEIRHEKGPNAIKHSLLNKGIEMSVIDKYLDQYSDDQIYSNALDMANKTLKNIIGLPIQKQKETIYSRLYRMGFDYNVINRVLSNIEYSDLDFQLLERDYQKLLSKEKDHNKIITKLLSKGYAYADIKKILKDNQE